MLLQTNEEFFKFIYKKNSICRNVDSTCNGTWLCGNFDTYNEMHAVYSDVLEGLTLKQCQEIHAVIDEHGKAFSKSKGQLDESWLR